MSILKANNRSLTTGEGKPGGRKGVRRAFFVLLAVASVVFVVLPWAVYFFPPGPRGWFVLYGAGGQPRQVFMVEMSACDKITRPDQTCQNLEIAAQKLGLSNVKEEKDAE